jgi:Uma2 family endonuclease
MSAAVTHSGQRITPAEFDRLPVDTDHRYEIEDGLLLVNARPAAPHAKAASRLVRQLGGQLPADVEVVVEPEAELPGPSPRRVQDLAIVPTDWGSARVRADQISLAIEIVSPGESWFRDYLKKPAEYAQAGILFLWVVDVIQQPPTLTPYTHAEGDTEYHLGAPLTGTCNPPAPWPLRVDLDALVTRPGPPPPR